MIKQRMNANGRFINMADRMDNIITLSPLCIMSQLCINISGETQIIGSHGFWIDFCRQIIFIFIWFVCYFFPYRLLHCINEF